VAGPSRVGDTNAATLRVIAAAWRTGEASPARRNAACSAAWCGGDSCWWPKLVRECAVRASAWRPAAAEARRPGGGLTGDESDIGLVSPGPRRIRPSWW
jgi:hypothetical protein